MFGNQRFVWNQMLAMLNARYQNSPQALFPNKYALIILLPTLKQEYPFLKISNSQALQLSCELLYDAFKRFFKRIVGLTLSFIVGKLISKASLGNKVVLWLVNIKLNYQS